MLNYLGYSWVDQGVNLDEGMKMIRRAVEQRPDDGYIVDSLGWAYFRTGNIRRGGEESRTRRRDLKPDDPTINDHLGDAYWKIGRQLEAQFQWQHALLLKPEPDELRRSKRRSRVGLPDDGTERTAEKASPAMAADRAVTTGLDGAFGFAPAKINLTLRVAGAPSGRLSRALQPGLLCEPAMRLRLSAGPRSGP